MAENMKFELAPVDVHRGTELAGGIQKTKQEIVGVIESFAGLFKGLKAFKNDIEAHKNTIDEGYRTNAVAQKAVTEHKGDLDNASKELKLDVEKLEKTLAAVTTMIVAATQEVESPVSKPEVSADEKGAVALATEIAAAELPKTRDAADEGKIVVVRGHNNPTMPPIGTVLQ